MDRLNSLLDECDLAHFDISDICKAIKRQGWGPLKATAVGCTSSQELNVAADISEQLCDSVATKLEGKVLGTFTSETNSK